METSDKMINANQHKELVRKSMIVTAINPRTRYMRVFCNGEDVTRIALEAELPVNSGVRSLGWIECVMQKNPRRTVCIEEDGQYEILTYRLHGWVSWRPVRLDE